MPTRLKECEILLRVTSEALNNVESELLTTEQRNAWRENATRSLQAAVRKLIEAERDVQHDERIAALRDRLKENVARLARHGIIVDDEGRVVRRGAD